MPIAVLPQRIRQSVGHKAPMVRRRRRQQAAGADQQMAATRHQGQGSTVTAPTLRFPLLGSFALKLASASTTGPPSPSGSVACRARRHAVSLEGFSVCHSLVDERIRCFAVLRLYRHCQQ